jgi:glycosyltransferase involved in cell wall biosynthesis
MTKYSVLIPFYNEETIIRQNTLRVYNHLRNKGYDFELILVNDSSKDESFKLAKILAKKYSKIKVLSYNNGPTRRENLFWSFPKTTGDIIAFTYIDLAVHEKYLDTLFDTLKNQNAGICIGSRYDDGAVFYRGIGRNIISVCYHKVLQLLFGCLIRDFQCGFKAFKRRTILKLLNECGYDHSFTRGWFFQ